MNDIESRVIRIIMEQCGFDRVEDVRMEHSFRGDFDIDSIDEIELVMLMEMEFNIEIPDEAAEKVKTVQDAVNLIKHMLPKEKQSMPQTAPHRAEEQELKYYVSSPSRALFGPYTKNEAMKKASALAVNARTSEIMLLKLEDTLAPLNNPTHAWVSTL